MFLFVRYLENSKRAVGEAQIHEYSWGQRAHQEVDKKQLLSLIAEVRIVHSAETKVNYIVL